MVKADCPKLEISNDNPPERFWNQQDSNYAKFRMHRNKLPGLNVSFLVFIALPTIAMINIYKGLIFIPVSDWKLKESSTVEIITWWCWCLRVLPGWLLILCQITELNLEGYVMKILQKFNIEKAWKNDCCLEDFVIVSFSISMCVMLIAEATSCFDKSKYCETRLTPSIQGITFYEIVLSLVVGNTYLQVSLVGSSWVVIFSSWLIEFLSVVLSVYLSGSFKEIPITIGIFFMSLFAIIEYENQIYNSFLSSLRHESLILKALTEKNEKILAEVQRTEINFLVANTAHDMKTPLQVTDCDC